MSSRARAFRTSRSLLAAVLSICILPLAGVGAVPAAADSGRILALGDSVMLGARTALHDVGVQKVDAKVSRQASTAAGLLRKRGTGLPHRVVIHLGTNGTFSLQDCRSIMKAVGPDRRVFLVNLKVARRWEASDNKAINVCAGIHADQVTLIDWHRASMRHPDWLYSDGMHLRPRGARGYAKLIADAIQTDVSHHTFDTT